MSQPTSHRRATPTQARSAATFEKILQAATTVLVEGGLQALNTNAVADAAGVNVGTVYHYFPDKHAILVELYFVDQARRTDYFSTRLAVLSHETDLDQWVTEILLNLMALRRQFPASTFLRRACRAVPALVELEAIDRADMAEGLAVALRRRFPGLEPERASAVGSALIEVGTALLDRASLEPGSEEAIMREAIAITSSYLHAVDPEQSKEGSFGTE